MAIAAAEEPGSVANANPLRRLVTSNARTLGAVALTWGIVAVIATTTAFIAIRGDGFSLWLSILRPMLWYYSVWAALSIVIYWLVEILSGSPGKRALGVVAHLSLFALITLSMPFVAHYENWQEWMYGDRAAGFHMLGAVIYVLNLVGSLLIRFYRLSVIKDREARDARLRSSLLENQLNLARIDALKMQINPHFLFNSLNSIAALIETSRNVEAYHATELLGGLLRNVLDQSSDRFLPLEKEVDFVERYVEVEKVRFGSRFEFSVSLSEESRAFEVPALILQPLIENAIKHAVNPSTTNVCIVLTAVVKGNGMLSIELLDTGPGLTGKGQAGYGLANIEKRLDLIYHDEARFEIANHADGGAIARLQLPPLPNRARADRAH